MWVTVLHSYELQTLRARRADGDDHPSGVGELGEQSGRQIRSSCGDQDGVEWSFGTETECTVPGENSDVGVAKFGEKIAGTIGQGRVTLDGEDLRR